MSEVTVSVNGVTVSVAEGTTVAAAVNRAGVAVFRLSVTGGARAPLCGMGICYECRVTLDGVRHERSCNIPCRSGMEILTDAP